MSDQALPAIAAPARPAPLLSVALVNFRSHDPADWRFLVERAVAAEQAGVDGVVVSDHVVMGEHLEAYGRPELGGMDGGRQPTGPDGHWLEPLTSLGVIAGATSAVRLGTGILLAALRRPAVLAKTAATLDVLSGGRLDLGVGVGWQREEYEAAGLDFGRRGRLLDHTLEVCQRLWLDRCAAYDAPELRFRDITEMALMLGDGPRDARFVTQQLYLELASFTGVDGHRIVEPGTLEFGIARSAGDIVFTHAVELTGEKRHVDHTRPLHADVTVA